MSIRLVVGIIALASLTGFAPAPKPRPPKEADPKEIAKNIQGTWQIISTESKTATGKITRRSTVQINIQGINWSYIYANAAQLGGRALITTTPSYTISLNPSKKVVQMDLIRPGTSTPYMSGIVTVEGDTMKWCYIISARIGSGGVRPQAFDPIPEGAYLMTLKRVSR